LIVSAILIFAFSPIEDKNKPLDEIEKKVYRRRAIIILVAEVVLAFGLIIINLMSFAVCIIFSLVTLSVLLIVSKVSVLTK